MWGVPPQGVPLGFDSLVQGSDLLVVGDSRGQSDIVPSVLERAGICTQGANICLPGASPINQCQILVQAKILPKQVVFVTSPASVYGIFYQKPESVLATFSRNRGPAKRILSGFKHPYAYLEGALVRPVKQRMRVTYGLQGFFGAAFYGVIPESYDRSGWHALTRLGDDVNFTRRVNLEGYANHLLEKGGEGEPSTRDRAMAEAMGKMQPRVHFVVIRAPCAPEMRAVEDGAFPNFDERMQRVVSPLGVQYITDVPLDGVDWALTDTSHLSALDALRYSKSLAVELQKTRVGVSDDLVNPE